jgi:hypothetical protein
MTALLDRPYGKYNRPAKLVFGPLPPCNPGYKTGFEPEDIEIMVNEWLAENKEMPLTKEAEMAQMVDEWLAANGDK